MKKYELTDETRLNIFGTKLYRIRACRPIETSQGSVSKGDLGGFAESEDNLSQDDNCWIAGNAMVWGDAEVRDDAVVYENAVVSGDAVIKDNGKVFGNAIVCDNAKVLENAKVYGSAIVGEGAEVTDHAEVYGDARVSGAAQIRDKARVFGSAWIMDNAMVSGSATVSGKAQIGNEVAVLGNSAISGDATVGGFAIFKDNALVRSDKDFLCITPVGDYADSLTFFKTKDAKLGGAVNSDIYIISDLGKMAEEMEDGWQKEMLLAVARVAEKYIDPSDYEEDED